MVKIFSKKALEFTTAAGDKVQVRALDFAEVDESVKADQMFKWAVADGDVQVFETTQVAVKVPEKTPEQIAAEEAAKAAADKAAKGTDKPQNK